MMKFKSALEVHLKTRIRYFRTIRMPGIKAWGLSVLVGTVVVAGRAVLAKLYLFGEKETEAVQESTSYWGLPDLVGTVVLAGRAAVLAKLFLFGDKKMKALVTVQDSTSYWGLPVLVGTVVVAGTAVLAKLFLFGDKKKKILGTLQDFIVTFHLKLIAKKEISHDTTRFTFAFQSAEHIQRLPVGQHIYLFEKIDGQLVICSYTPVTIDYDHGYMDLVIKVDCKNLHSKLPEECKMSQNMEIGDYIDGRGPNGPLYDGKGTFKIHADKKSEPQTVVAKRVGIIAGGTGITPMLQLVRQVLKDSDDKTEISLLFANQTENDILLRSELEDIHAEHKQRFKLWYTLDRPPATGWKYSTGFVNDQMIKDHLPGPEEGTLILMCGPPPMINSDCHPNLDKLGYSPNMCFAYEITTVANDTQKDGL